MLTVNLDADPEEEQVIAVKKLSDVSSPVHILIADADPGQGTYYYQSWEGETLATDTHVFSLSVMDVVGDHGAQIVVNGMNDAGKLTLDIFRAVPSRTTKGLTYKPIFQLVGDEISIEEVERPDSYSTDQQPGPSFPIQVYLRDPDSTNVLDLVSILYTWKASEGRYVPGPAQKIPGEDVQQAKLKELYLSAGEDAFERFIDGSWVQADPSSGAAGFTSIIDFDTRNRTISVATGNTAEDVYDWTESHRTIYKTLRVVGENQTVPLIKLIRRFTITADSPTSITVQVNGEETTEQITTVYTKVTDEMRSQLLERADAHVGNAAMSLQGTYTGPGGVVVDFGDARLTWSEGGRKVTESYVLFSLGTATILTTRVAATESSPEQTNSWLVGYQERNDTSVITRTISLSSVRLTVSGYEDSNGSDYMLTQTADVKKK